MQTLQNASIPFLSKLSSTVGSVFITTGLTILVSEVTERLFSLKFDKKISQGAGVIAGVATIVIFSPTLAIGLSSGFLFGAYKIYCYMNNKPAIEVGSRQARGQEQVLEASAGRISQLEAELDQARNEMGGLNLQVAKVAPLEMELRVAIIREAEKKEQMDKSIATIQQLEKARQRAGQEHSMLPTRSGSSLSILGIGPLKKGDQVLRASPVQPQVSSIPRIASEAQFNLEKMPLDILQIISFHLGAKESSHLTLVNKNFSKAINEKFHWRSLALQNQAIAWFQPWMSGLEVDKLSINTWRQLSRVSKITLKQTHIWVKKNPVRFLALRADGSLFEGCSNSILGVDGKELHSLKLDASPCAGAVLEDGQLALGLGGVKRLVCIVGSDGNVKQTLNCNRNRPTSVVALPEGRVAYGTKRGTVYVSRICANSEAEPKMEANFNVPGGVASMLVLPNGCLAVGSKMGKIYIWNISDWELKQTLESGAEFDVYLTSLPDGRFVTGSWQTIHIRNLNGQVEQTLGVNGEVNVVSSLRAFPDGRIAVGSSNGLISIWGTNGALIQILQGHSGSVTSLEIRPNGSLISGSLDRTIRVWSLDDGSGVTEAAPKEASSSPSLPSKVSAGGTML